MILSFKDRDTERVFLGEYSKKLPRELHKKALTKLLAIHASNEIEELKIPPSNRLLMINTEFAFISETEMQTKLKLQTTTRRKNMKTFFNVHPGEVLKEYLEELNISAYQLSKSIGISQSYFSELFKKKKNVTARTSILLGKFFNLNDEYWLKIQNHYDVIEEKRKLKSKLKTVKPWREKKAA